MSEPTLIPRARRALTVSRQDELRSDGLPVPDVLVLEVELAEPAEETLASSRISQNIKRSWIERRAPYYRLKPAASQRV